ncbi:group II intron reverse transcriptase/maturase, partial [Ralstonia pseudosolanacearum]
MLTDEAQMHERVQPTAEEGGRNLPGADGGAEAGTAAVGQTKAQVPSLMEAVVETSNMRLAYRRVVSNGGAAGVD